MLLSIIIVSKNNVENIRITLDSIDALSIEDFEIIICEGGSKSNNVHSEKFKITELLGPDAGIYDGMNRGIKAASGQIIWFLNSGDMAKNSVFIPFIINQFVQSDSSILRANQDNPNRSKIWNKFPLFHFAEKFLIAGVNPIPHQSTLFKRNIFDRLGLYDLSQPIFADQHFFIQAILHKEKFAKSKIAISHHQPSGVGDKVSRESFLNNCKESRLSDIFEFSKGQVALNYIYEKIVRCCLK